MIDVYFNEHAWNDRERCKEHNNNIIDFKFYIYLYFIQ